MLEARHFASTACQACVMVWRCVQILEARSLTSTAWLRRVMVSARFGSCCSTASHTCTYNATYYDNSNLYTYKARVLGVCGIRFCQSICAGTTQSLNKFCACLQCKLLYQHTRFTLFEAGKQLPRSVLSCKTACILLKITSIHAIKACTFI